MSFAVSSKVRAVNDLFVDADNSSAIFEDEEEEEGVRSRFLAGGAEPDPEVEF